MNTNIEAFIKKEQEKACAHSIVFNLQESEKVKYAERLCSGFFEAQWPLEDDANIEKYAYLTTAIKKPIDKWLPILVHETCHMDQYIEKSTYWMSTKEYSVLDAWLEGKDFSHQEIKRTIENVILMEADCEIRTIEKIKEFNLPIDVKYYAQRANSYLLFHHYMIENRTWCKIPPYEIIDIINNMPQKMKEITEYLKKPEKNVIKLFSQCVK